MPMTPEQARKRLRSLRYRKRLQASTCKKEAELMIYVWEQGGQAVIDGYRVTLTDGKLSWERLPEVHSRQLSLFAEHKKGDDDGPL
jgi:hypothetical protein